MAKLSARGRRRGEPVSSTALAIAERQIIWPLTCDNREKGPATAATVPGCGRPWRVDVADATCSIEGCERPAGVPGSAWGWCRSHYKRWYRYGDPEAQLRRIPKWTAPCSIGDCGGDVYAHGLCATHYARQRRCGSTELVERIDPGCAEPGCDESHYGLGLCKSHYGAQRRRMERKKQSRSYRRSLHASRARTSRERGAHGSHTLLEWEEKLTRYKGLCAYCGRPADTADHVVPIAHGGTDDIDNIVPACRSCNCSKSDRALGDWIAWKALHGEVIGEGATPGQALQLCLPIDEELSRVR